MAFDEELRELAALQYAVVALRQARQLSPGPAALRHRIEGSDWDMPTPRVLRLVGAPRGIRQDLMIAVLDAGPGAVVSHGSAAALWGLPGFSFSTHHVSRPRSRSRCEALVAVVHHPRFLPASHVTDRHGIPVTTLARTLFDLAGGVHPARLDRLVETVVGRSPSILPTLHAMLEELGATGRGGITVLRAVLADRPPGYVATASGLEARFARILADAGEPPLDRQVDVGGHEWVGRVDFLDRALKIVVEVDSDIHHSSPLDRARDARRDGLLREAGWAAVVRISEDEIWRHPHQVVARVRAARRQVGRALVAGSVGLATDPATSA
ncbi:MAG: DUF559 domain-containing protein [Actinomycetota bacterium]